MDPLSLITSLLTMAASVPAIGKVLAIAVGWAAIIPGVVTALVGVWHAVVGLAAALGTVFPALSGLASRLQADDTVVEADSNVVLSWIERLSAIPVPQTSSSPTPPPSSPPAAPSTSAS